MGNVFKKETPEAKLLRPNGLYVKLKCDPKTMKKLITEKKVAPFYVGTDVPSGSNDEECPICMLNYPGGLNRARCCRKSVCTECYFSIRPAGLTSAVDCPFCQQPGYTAVFNGPLAPEERQRIIDEERKVLELERKMREEEIERDRQREIEREKKLEEEQKKRDLKKLEEEQKKKEEKEQRLESENRRKKTDELKSITNQPNLNTNLNRNPSSNLSNVVDNRITNDQNQFDLAFNDLSPQELEDRMLNEAIRLSLLDSQPVLQNPNSENTADTIPQQVINDQVHSEETLEFSDSDEFLYSDPDDSFKGVEEDFDECQLAEDNSQNSDDEVLFIKKRREK